jgi:hypothetical protein
VSRRRAAERPLVHPSTAAAELLLYVETTGLAYAAMRQALELEAAQAEQDRRGQSGFSAESRLAMLRATIESELRSIAERLPE